MKIKRTKTVTTPSMTGQKGDAAQSAGMGVSANTGNLSTAKHDVTSGTTSNKGSGTGGGSGVTFNNNISSSSQENSNSSTTSSGTSTTAHTAGGTTSTTCNKVPNHSPFEKLKQAILEQEKQNKQANKQQLSKSTSELMKEGGTGSHGNKGKPGDGGSLTGGGSSNFSCVFNRASNDNSNSGFHTGSGGSSHGNNNNNKHHARQQKSDPYEFNAKIEDRLLNSVSGLPSKKLKLDKVRYLHFLYIFKIFF